MEHKALLHLYNRFSFGLRPDEYERMQNKSRLQVVNHVFKNKTTYKEMSVDMGEIENYFKTLQKEKRTKLTKEESQMFAKLGRKKLRELNNAWIDRLINSNDNFREKMTLFWANVFVCRDNQAWFAQQYNNTLRRHALGNFRDFVKAIAKQPSMSKYLNNNQNFKGSPNENFARELMELFTLGAGNYTENDIKEAARAFTGWSFKREGSFFLRKRRHDYGEKEFFGKRGNFNGDDIIDIILEQKQCAKFICEKIYRYFVNPIINNTHISEMVTLFYRDYDIEKLMRHVFMSDWFYADSNMGSKIKSPIELIVGITNTVPFRFEKPSQLLYVQKMLGQVLLYPPNVAGWKGDKSWIDSNTLMFRLKLASVLLNDAVINLDEKGSLEDSFEMYYQRTRNRKKFFKIERDWESFTSNYSKVTISNLENHLIVSKIDEDTKSLLLNLNLRDKKDHCIQLMSLPEYQMC